MTFKRNFIQSFFTKILLGSWLKHLPLIHSYPFLTVNCRSRESPDSFNLYIKVRKEIVDSKENHTRCIKILPTDLRYTVSETNTQYLVIVDNISLVLPIYKIQNTNHSKLYLSDISLCTESELLVLQMLKQSVWIRGIKEIAELQHLFH